MVDMKDKVAAALDTIQGVSVYYQMPKAKAKFPAITYYESGNAPDTSADDSEYTSLIAISIDVWGNTAREMSDLAVQADQVMAGIGFTRRMAYELPDPSGKYRKAMRFEAVKG